MAIYNSCYQYPKIGFFSQSGQISERGVSFHHRVGIGFPEHPLDLIVMIHDPDPIKARCFCCCDDFFQFWPDSSRAARVLERRNLESNVHKRPPMSSRYVKTPCEAWRRSLPKLDPRREVAAMVRDRVHAAIELADADDAVEVSDFVVVEDEVARRRVAADSPPE